MVDEKNEEERVEAALAKPETTDPGWLEAIYREDATVVLQTAYRVTGRIEDAEDVLQTVFARLVEHEVRTPELVGPARREPEQRHGHDRNGGKQSAEHRYAAAWGATIVIGRLSKHSMTTVSPKSHLTIRAYQD